MTIASILEAARGLLIGEPARAIGYGAAVVIYFAAKALGSIPDQSLDEALLSAGVAIGTVASVVESIRRFVYSQPTVVAIAELAAATGYADVPAPPADGAR